MPDGHADPIVRIPFAVHDVEGLHKLARTLWTTSNGSAEGVDAVLGPIDAPDLEACVREVLDGANLGITLSMV